MNNKWHGPTNVLGQGGHLHSCQQWEYIRVHPCYLQLIPSNKNHDPNIMLQKKSRFLNLPYIVANRCNPVNQHHYIISILIVLKQKLQTVMLTKLWKKNSIETVCKAMSPIPRRSNPKPKSGIKSTKMIIRKQQKYFQKLGKQLGSIPILCQGCSNQ